MHQRFYLALLRQKTKSPIRLATDNASLAKNTQPTTINNTNPSIDDISEFIIDPI
jgi:hypothetical protein